MRKLAWFAFSAAVAIALAVYLPDGYVWWAAALAVAVSGLAVSRLRRRAAIALLGLLFGLFWTEGYRMLTPVPDSTEQKVQMTVAEYPTPARYGSSVAVSLRQGGKTMHGLAYLNDTQPELAPGDVLDVSVALRPVGDQYSESSSMYYRALGYVFTASLGKKYTVTKAERLPVWAVPAWLAHSLREKIDSLFAEDTAPFLRALLTGDRSELSYGRKNDLSVSGISHVAAISGMHVSVLVALLAVLLRRRKRTTAVGIPVILVFMMMTGARPSVVRASVMQILLLLAPLARRQEDPPTSLGLALLLILMHNPWAITDLGLQLSFAATIGIVVFGSRMNRVVRDYTAARWGRFSRTRTARFLTATVCTTLSALIFTTPLVAVSFGLISLLSVVTNLLTLQAVTACFQVGLLVCLVGFVCQPVALVVAWLLNWLVRYVLAVSHLIARLPFSAVYTQNSYLILWLVFAYLLLGVFLWRKGRQPVIFGCCLAPSLFLCLGTSWLEEVGTQFQTTILDVGEGQCVLISGDGVEIMVDCGGSDPEQAGETACRYQLSRGKPKLDVLMLTHYDSDHAGGVLQLLDRLQVSALYLPDVERESSTRQAIEAAAAETNTPVFYVTRDLELQYGRTYLHLFAPVSNADENDASLSLWCSRQDYDILITGDMTARAEHSLLQTHSLPKVELLIAGHHGSATSTGRELLAAVRPDAVAISVGADNRYGHPAQQTLDRIAEAGATVFRTDQLQTITVRR